MSGLVKGFKGLVVATGMELNVSSASIEVGTTYQLTPTFTPSNPTNDKIYWTSSDTSVATVDDRGLVTPVSPGNVIITAVADYGGYTDTCNCQIFKIDVTGISLNENSIVLGEGDTFQLEATIIPSDASLKGVVWSSSNTNYATVDETGLVTYVAPGDCTITVTTVDGGYTATCACSSRIRVTGLELNSTSINVKAGETFQLEATITPDNATLKTVTWNSSNTSVATVSQNGLVTYVGDGNCTITCTSNDNNEIYDTCSVECTSFVPVDICFGYTGTEQSILLEPHEYCIEVWGAQGGFYTTNPSGKGGYAAGCINITTPTCLYIYVGGQGCSGYSGAVAYGGWNGGGCGYSYSSRYDGGGGGGTDVRIGGNTIYHRRIVAGGGGGGGAMGCCVGYGGAGGGINGETGGTAYSSFYGGGGGTQIAGGAVGGNGQYMVAGSFGQGGYKTSGNGGYNGSGGGGGWYGGGPGAAVSAAGGGGSGYVYTTSTCSSAPSGYCHCTAYMFTGACCCCGNVSFPTANGGTETGHSGCGCVRIRSL